MPGEHRKHTPIVSKAQKTLFGIARGIQKGEVPASYSPEAAKLAKSQSVEIIRSHLTETRGKKLPKHSVLKRRARLKRRRK